LCLIILSSRRLGGSETPSSPFVPLGFEPRPASAPRP